MFIYLVCVWNDFDSHFDIKCITLDRDEAEIYGRKACLKEGSFSIIGFLLQEGQHIILNEEGQYILADEIEPERIA